MPLYPGLCNYIINAGSVGQPRDNDLRACYIILDASDTKNPTVEMVRLDYPFKETQKKIKEIYKEQDNGKEFVQTIYYHVGYRLELGR